MTGVDVNIGLRTLLIWLHGQTNACALSLFWGLIFAVSFIIERSGIVSKATTDPLDLPDLVGPKGRSFKVSQ